MAAPTASPTLCVHLSLLHPIPSCSPAPPGQGQGRASPKATTKGAVSPLCRRHGAHCACQALL